MSLMDRINKTPEMVKAEYDSPAEAPKQTQEDRHLTKEELEQQIADNFQSTNTTYEKTSYRKSTIDENAFKRKGSNKLKTAELNSEEIQRVKDSAIILIAASLPDWAGESEEDVDNMMLEKIDKACEETGITIDKGRREDLLHDVKADVYGLGPIRKLIDDPEITEIMVNGPRQVFVERHGKLELTDVKFDDNAHVKRIIDKIVAPLGRHIDDSTPMVDARLKNGSRVNAIIPPCSLGGPTLTIRKFSDHPYQVSDLLNFGSLNETMAEFLEQAVRGRLNILISGGTGSGKTTLLNVLSSYIPADERIITVEDSAELKLQQEHVVSLESRPANIEGTGQITIRDLVRNTLRMRPDRIVVGEVRGGECLDMLQAMNTGHDGSLTTIHANSPRDALMRAETLSMMAGMELPESAIRQQCASAFNLIVQQARFRDGTRKITSITEVCGMGENVITTQEIFKFNQLGEQVNRETGQVKIVGEYIATGIKPRCCKKMIDNGAVINNTWFEIQPAAAGARKR